MVIDVSPRLGLLRLQSKRVSSKQKVHQQRQKKTKVNTQRKLFTCPFIQTLRRFFCFSQLSSLHLLRAMQLRNVTISFIHGFAIPPSFFGFMYKFPAFLPMAHSSIKKHQLRNQKSEKKTGINTNSQRRGPNKHSDKASFN